MTTAEAPKKDQPPFEPDPEPIDVPSPSGPERPTPHIPGSPDPKPVEVPEPAPA